MKSGGQKISRKLAGILVAILLMINMMPIGLIGVAIAATTTITVTVVDQDNGAIANAAVTIDNNAPINTGVDGKAVFSDINVEDNINIAVVDANYSKEERTVSSSEVEVQVMLDSHDYPIEVQDPSGNPVENAIITIQTTGKEDETVETNENGEVKLKLLHNTAYTIFAQGPEGSVFAASNVTTCNLNTNEANTQIIQLKIDSNAPSITSETSNANYGYNSKKAEFKWIGTVTDGALESGLNQVSYGTESTYSSETTTPIVVDGNGKYTFTAAENNTYYVWAHDNAGNEAKQPVVVDGIDKTAPVITKDNDNSKINDTKSKYTYVCSISDEDNGSGIKEARFGSNPEFSNGDTTPRPVEEGKSTFNYISNGTYYVWAFDYAGNRSCLEITINEIDDISPTITDIEQNPAQEEWKAEVTVSCLGTDDNSGIHSVRYSKTENDYNSSNFSDSTFNQATAVAGQENKYKFEVNENITYYIWAFDNAGNKSGKYSTVIEHVDTQGPTLETPTYQMQRTGEDVVISIEATDDRGVKDVRVGDNAAFTSNSGTELTKVEDSDVYNGTVISGTTYSFWANDNLDNKSDELTHTIVPDDTAPVIGTITNPAEWAQEKTIIIPVTDNDKIGVVKWGLKTDLEADVLYDTTKGLENDTTNDEENNLSYLTYSDTDNAYTIKLTENGDYGVIAYDVAGNHSEISSVTVNKIDTIKPVVDDLEKDPSTKFSANVVKVTVSVSDTGTEEELASGIASVKYNTTNDISGASIAVEVEGEANKYEFTTPDDEFNGTYYVWAVDNAGNTSDVGSINVKIDKTNPVIENITFRVLDDEGNVIEGEALNHLKHGTYKNASIYVDITANDKEGIATTYSGVKEIKLWQQEVAETIDDGNWVLVASKMGKKVTFKLDPPYNQYLRVEVIDTVDNTSGKVVPSTINSNILDVNTLFMLEKTAPTINAENDVVTEGQEKAKTYTDAAKNIVWYPNETTHKITFADNTEGQFNSGLSTVSVKGTKKKEDDTLIYNLEEQLDGNGEEEKTLTKEYTFKLSEFFETGETEKTEGWDTITYEVTDNAGNTNSVVQKLGVDYTLPEISKFEFNTIEGLKQDTVELTPYGFIFKEDTQVTIIPAEDTVGIREIEYYTVDRTDKDNQVESTHVFQELNEEGVVTFTVPANFKGMIYARAIDNLDRTPEDFSNPLGVIVESPEKHLETSEVAINIPSSTKIDQKGNKLYKADASVVLSVADYYSGIKKVSYKVEGAQDSDKNQSGEVSFDISKEYTVNNSVADWNIKQMDFNLVTKIERGIVVNNNSNEIKITVKLEDNAGNTSEETKTISIDKTNPTVSVEYNNNAYDTTFITEKEYYKANRTATIKIKERNFKPDDVLITITNTKGVIPSISRWESSGDGDETEHTATIAFDTDGDYTFDIAYTDLAGNSAADYDADTFTIDKKQPIVNSLTKVPVKVATDGKARITATVSDVNDGSGIGGIKYNTEDNYGSATTITTVANGGNDSTFSFDTTDDDFKGFYYVWCYDKAGNVSESKKIEVLIDKTTPKVDGFNFAIKDAKTGDVLNALTHGTYANCIVEVTVSASDKSAAGKDIGSGVKTITLYQKDAGADDSTREKAGEYTVVNGKEEAVFELAPFYNKVLLAEAIDNVGRTITNVLPTEANSNIKNSGLMLEENLPTIDIARNPLEDTIGPYTNSEVNWYSDDIPLTVTVKDADAGIYSVGITINDEPIVTDKNGKAINALFYENYTNEQVFVINTDQRSKNDEGKYNEGLYKIKVTTIDNAGNVKTESTTIGVDYSTPQIAKFQFDPLEAVDPNNPSIEITKYGFFFKKDTKVTIHSATDVVGVKSITYYTKDYTNDKSGVKSEEITKNVEDDGSISFVIPANFKGTILATTTDYLGRFQDVEGNKFTNPDSAIIEDAAKHAETSEINISLPSTSKKDNEGNRLYKENTDVTLTVGDYFSGIQKIEWKIEGSADSDNNKSGTSTFDAEDASEKEIINGWSIKKTDFNLVTEVSKKITVTNNSNNIKVWVKLTDRVGNTSEKTTTFSIDKTEPKIEVTYDNNTFDTAFSAESEYYKQNRTAKIVITERNFKADDVKVTITNTDTVIPTVSSWQSSGEGDGKKNTATILYDADGDYNFDIEFVDLAGNAANDYEGDQFTIDKTIPVINVSFDNNNAINNQYYDATRTATVKITEHNFETSRISVVSTALDNGKPITAPTISGWATSGDIHTATVRYENDGLYTFDIDYTDKAGNDAADVDEQKFYIDLTTPEIKITGVVDKSANNGVVIPLITVTDTNFDKNGVQMEVTGVNSGTMMPKGAFENIANGQKFQFEDFDHTKKIDDIYTLKVAEKDLAGNGNENSIMFSVNRFGSVYVFDDSLKSFQGQYNQKEIDVIVTETNVDHLKSNTINIKVTYNGAPRDLKINEDYTIEKLGGEGEWSQYVYKIKSDVFAGDGQYIVTFYSVDEAGNVNESVDETKAAELWFGIDKTPPVIIPVDLESKMTYPMESKKATISINDNLVLQDFTIYLNDKKQEYTASENEYTFTIPSSNKKQSVKIVAHDAAGNETIQEINDFYVTTSTFVRWYTNKALFVSSIVGVGVIGTGGAAFALFGKSILPFLK